ncbi:unnamed protein product, partial [Effrenium voratum]
SNLALRAITTTTGPHSDSLWKAAAACEVEHFVKQEQFFLGIYGYRVLTNKTWVDGTSLAGQTPALSLKTSEHIEQAGHTWYVIQCQLTAFTGEREVLSWEAPRRLSQLRKDLHDRIKFGMGQNEYRSIFEEAPFAHSGGLTGTTSRLSRWLSHLATSINKLEVPPAVAALTLTFLHAPLPRSAVPPRSDGA